jgi:phosphoglycolate phosphatase-like HAD superfamily hydrolase
MISRVAAVLLDLDGTLVDSRVRFAAAYRTALCDHGLPIADDGEFLERCTAGTLLSSLAISKSEWPAFWNALMAAFVSKQEQSEPIPGAIEAVRALSDRGFRLAVVTGRGCTARAVKDELRDAGFEELFDHVLSVGGPDQVEYLSSGAQTKQSLFREACNLLSRNAAECAYASDWPEDLDEAARFGLTPLVGVTTGGYAASAFSVADVVLGSVADLPRVL